MKKYIITIESEKNGRCSLCSHWEHRNVECLNCLCQGTPIESEKCNYCGYENCICGYKDQQKPSSQEFSPTPKQHHIDKQALKVVLDFVDSIESIQKIGSDVAEAAELLRKSLYEDT